MSFQRAAKRVFSGSVAKLRGSPSFQGKSPNRRGERGEVWRGGPLWSPALPQRMESHYTLLPFPYDIMCYELFRIRDFNVP
jgi:hypothetical protein